MANDYYVCEKDLHDLIAILNGGYVRILDGDEVKVEVCLECKGRPVYEVRAI